MNRAAALCTNGWAGYMEQPCRVIGETPKRWRITVDADTRLAGRNRWLRAGESCLVPKGAVKFQGAAQ